MSGKFSRLTPREIDVLRLVVAGERNKAIAHQLGINLTTVKMHQKSITAKLGVDRRRYTIVKVADAGRAFLAVLDQARAA